MELVEPIVGQRRGSFRMVYAKPKEQCSKSRQWPRLLDCLLCIAAHDDDEYFDAPAAGEFAVVDVVTKEKAWFEMPHGATPENVTGMIESTFAASAFRVGDKLWFV